MTNVAQATVEQETQGAIVSTPERALPVLGLLFLASGCAALIYEIVWFQLLELVIGSSSISLGILLGTFMGGLCLGSLALSRLVSARFHPLLVYGVLEIGIGGFAIAVLFGLPSVAGFYVAYANHGLASIFLRGAICALLLLPPTIFMGATLPAIARWVAGSQRAMSSLGMLYTANIVGAVFGCLLAGFYLLRVHDMAVATYVAAAINATLATIAFSLAATTSYRAPIETQPADRTAARSSGIWVVYAVTGLSGLTALGAQVVWTRLLALLMGSTVYTFSIILAVFLIGLGTGSAIGSSVARARPHFTLGLCQLLLVAGIAWGATAIHASLPFWPIDLALTTSPWYVFQLDLMRVLWAIFPATFLWGASFPLALAAAASPGEDAARITGRVYAANTIGAIVGALTFSLVLIPAIGTFQSQRVLMGISLLAGMSMLVVLMPDRKGLLNEQSLSARAGMSCGMIAALVSASLIWAINGPPAGLLAFGREILKWGPSISVLFAGEGINSTVAVAENDQGARTFFVSGSLEASTTPHDMRTQRMLGHVSALLHRKPRTALVVGFGAGVTAGSLTQYPEIERIVICEIEPLIPKVVSTYFQNENYNVINDPRVEIIYDDARHYLLTTQEKFDIITSDPIHPQVKGSATLYTQDYFELVRNHLNPGGVVTQWVPFNQSTFDVVKSELATFFNTFPRSAIFSNFSEGWHYEVVLFGEASSQPIELDAIQQRLDSPEYSRVKRSLADVNFHSAVALMATYAGRAPDLKDWLRDAQINTDRNLRLQYLAGMGSLSQQAAQIFEDMTRDRDRGFPEDLFVASEETKDSLLEAMARHEIGQ